MSNAELGHYRRLGYAALNPRDSVIHNGIRRRPPPLPRAASRTLGFCGRLVPRKRPQYVQWILREEGFEAYSSLIAGRGFSAYARDLMADEELGCRVRYLGWCGRERLEAFYAQIGLVEILGGDAVYAKDDSYDSFREAMQRWLRLEQSALDAMTQRAHRRFCERFTDVTVAGSYRALFELRGPLPRTENRGGQS